MFKIGAGNLYTFKNIQKNTINILIIIFRTSIMFKVFKVCVCNLYTLENTEKKNVQLLFLLMVYINQV